MAAFVLDASVALGWILEGEVRADEARSLLDQVVREGAVVPMLWRLEVGNVLLAAERRGRLRQTRVDAVVAQLGLLPIARDEQTDDRAWSETRHIARRHALTLYDAAYLELALRRGLPLATFDGKLAAAAVADGVSLIAAIRPA